MSGSNHYVSRKLSVPGPFLYSVGAASWDFFGATLEQRKDGSKPISAIEATTWIEFAAA
jgi:hypothetical protein